MVETRTPLDYADVKRDLCRVSLAPLERFRGSPYADEVRALKLEPNVEQVMLGLNGRRDGLHLLRMLKRSGTERDFALAYLQFFTDRNNYNVFQLQVVNSEFNDSTMFWTFAPYLLKVMRSRGMQDGQSMFKILSWAERSPCKYQDGNPNTNNLQGLEVFGTESWFLGKDPTHVSHQFTEQEAERVADLLMEE